MTSNEPTYQLIDNLKRDKIIVGECMAAIPVLEKTLAPAPQQSISQMLTELALIFGNPWDDKQAATMAMRLYIEALGDLPAPALVYARDEYIRTKTFKVFPLPAELRAFGLNYIAPLRMALFRAKRVCGV